LYAHLVYLPFLEASKELKTKPAQNTVRDLREAGIYPEVIIARSEQPVNAETMHKLSLFCDVDIRGIVSLPTAETVYEVPLMLENAGMGDYVSKKLGLPRRKPKLADWQKLVETIKHTERPRVKIGVVAKYMSHEDTYMSVFEAIKAAGWANKVTAQIFWVDAEKLETEDAFQLLAGFDGLVVPGGFGSRAIEGKIVAAGYAMDQAVPYLGLCLGMQTAVVAFARKVLGDEANTTEVNPDTKFPVIDFMEQQRTISAKGGTMRLGNYPCKLAPGSMVKKLYKESRILERHRHRYEFNNHYREALTKAGLRLSGLSPDDELVEIVELANHPFFVGSQFHPEFKSRPGVPHPMFDGFIKAAAQHAKKYQRVSSRLEIEV
jgi:CTP synthase